MSYLKVNSRRTKLKGTYHHKKTFMCNETNNEEKWHVYVNLPANIFALGPTESFQADEGNGTSTAAGEP